jgi:hypothetical protein
MSDIWFVSVCGRIPSVESKFGSLDFWNRECDQVTIFRKTVNFNHDKPNYNDWVWDNLASWSSGMMPAELSNLIGSVIALGEQGPWRQVIDWIWLNEDYVPPHFLEKFKQIFGNTGEENG